MYKFSNASIDRLNTVYGPLQALSYAVLANSQYDFGIPQYGGKRTTREQQDLFVRKLSKKDGINNPSYHQSGMAVDIAIFEDGKYSNDADKYETVSKIFEVQFQTLKALGVFPATAVLRWGGDWNMNGIRVDKDKAESFMDLPHFELRNI